MCGTTRFSGRGVGGGGLVSLLEAPTITKTAIESVAIGSRLAGENPQPWEYDDSLPEPVQADWSLVTFSMTREDGSEIEVEMIRPTVFWQQQGTVPGASVFMEFPELEVSTHATVRKVEPCPPIAEGTGNVVTARIVTLTASELVDLELETGEVLTGTPPHLIWSVKGDDWLHLSEIEVGDEVLTEHGLVEVTSINLRATAETVYNLEVHGHHVYQVGVDGVLVHNANPYRRKNGKFGAKRGPKTSNKTPHNATIIAERDKIIKAGGTIVAGGRIKGLKEMVLKVRGGKTRRPDILYRDKAGKLRALQVGKRNAAGKPIPREQSALRDLRTRVPTTFVPYN
jgi:hypothetical protein